MESQNFGGVADLGHQQIRFIALKTKVSDKYVKLIIKGERERNSIKAKAVWAAYQELKKALSIGSEKAEQKIMSICEND